MTPRFRWVGAITLALAGALLLPPGAASASAPAGWLVMAARP